jgi:hypothetical protein
MQIATRTGDRFVLRWFRESDVPALTALHSDPDVMRFIRPNGEVETRPRQAWGYIAEQMGIGCSKVTANGRSPTVRPMN